MSRILAALILGVCLGGSTAPIDRHCFAAVADDRSNFICDFYVRLVMNP